MIADKEASVRHTISKMTQLINAKAENGSIDYEIKHRFEDLAFKHKYSFLGYLYEIKRFSYYKQLYRL